MGETIDVPAEFVEQLQSAHISSDYTPSFALDDQAAQAGSAAPSAVPSEAASAIGSVVPSAVSSAAQSAVQSVVASPAVLAPSEDVKPDIDALFSQINGDSDAMAVDEPPQPTNTTTPPVDDIKPEVAEDAAAKEGSAGPSALPSVLPSAAPSADGSPVPVSAPGSGAGSASGSVPPPPPPPPVKSALALQHVDVDLGALKSVSRNHAKIEYRSDLAQFCLEIYGRNGAWVDDRYYVKGTIVPLHQG